MARAPLIVGLILLAEALSPAQPAPLAPLFRELATPFDLIHLAKDRSVKIGPLEEFPGQPPNFEGVWTRRNIDNPDELVKFAKKDLLSVDFFETIGLAKVDVLLDPKAELFKDVSERERRLAAEKLVDGLLDFHLANRRHAPLAENGWRALRFALDAKLLKVRVLIAADLAKDADMKKDWRDAIAKADAWGLKDEARSMRVAQAKDRLAAGDLAAVRKIVDRLDEDGLAGPDAEQCRKALRERAEARFKEAKEAGGSQAAPKLEEALSFWPWLEGARDELAKLTKTYRVLYVAVRELPELLSPATAWSDTEKQAAELLFESLIQVRHDQALGQTYHNMLSRSLPVADGLTRRFSLRRDAYWSDGERLTSVDVRHTVQLLSAPEMAGRGAVWRDLLEPPRFEGNPFELAFTARQGLFDPFAPVTFKILPREVRGKPLARADDPDFAKAPLGSGPFIYAGRHMEDGQTYAVFRANPAYVRKSRPWSSAIREIRMFARAEAGKDLGQAPPHLMLNVPTDQLAAVAKLGYGDIRHLLAPRVHVLALNHRQPALANLNLRRALAHGLQRQAILDEAFGSEGKKYHHFANGPFPPKSWAACPPPRVPEDLNQPELAASYAKKAAAELGGRRLTLKFPAQTAGAAKACAALAKQIETLFADLPAKIEITPVPLSTQQMRDAISQRDYEIAYYHLDFPDENYWLWPLFDPHPDALRPGGSNYLGYEDAKLQNLLRSAMSTRQFIALAELQHSIHAHLVERMPLIPLWQLHEHVAVHSTLNPVGLDPLLVFPNVLEWKWNP